MKTGDIILFSGKSNQAKIIQKFQSINDCQSGKYNHSGIIINTLYNGLYVAEAAPIQQRKLKAAVILTPLDKIIEENDKVLKLSYNKKYEEKEIEKIILRYVGTPYDYNNLLLHQVIRIISGKWIGKNKKSDKKMVCHEFTMTVWDKYNNIFPKCRKAIVSDMYYNNNFNKHIIK